MKPYFSKNIPIEGEIKVGDLIHRIYPNGNRVLGQACTIESYNKNGVYRVSDPDAVWEGFFCFENYNKYGGVVSNDGYGKGNFKYEKVELFLCSREIEVGDKIRGEYSSTLSFDVEVIGEDNTGIPHWQVRGIDGNIYEYAKEDSFKVLGPISPKAGWVTYGMEFDEKDILENHVCDKCLNYKIKGPCGHFH